VRAWAVGSGGNGRSVRVEGARAYTVYRGVYGRQGAGLCMECMRQEWVAWFQSEDVGGVEGGPSVGQSERSKKGK
jgi:hypothetical protein